MPKESKPSQTDKRLATLAEKTEKNKREMVAELQKMPIVQVACERVGVSRAAYYKWRLDDAPFARAADRALEASKFRVNDMARSQLLRLIQSGNLTAIIFWLKNNDPAFSNRVTHQYDFRYPLKSAEEERSAEQLTLHALSWLVSQRRSPNMTGEEIRREFEREEAVADKEIALDDEAAKYFADTEIT